MDITTLMKKYANRFELMIVEVDNGVMTRIDDHVIIPTKLLEYQRMPKNGFYYLSNVTCDGKCSVGQPKESCIGSCYSEKKCAVYWPRPLSDYWTRLSFDEYCHIVTSVCKDY